MQNELFHHVLFSLMTLSRRTSGRDATWWQWTWTSIQPNFDRHLQRFYHAIVARNIRLLALFPHPQPTATIRTRRQQLSSVYAFSLRFISLLFSTYNTFACVRVAAVNRAGIQRRNHRCNRAMPYCTTTRNGQYYNHRDMRWSNKQHHVRRQKLYRPRKILPLYY